MAANKKERKVNSLQPSDSTIVKYLLLAGGETGSLTSPGSRAINMRSRREKAVDGWLHASPSGTPSTDEMSQRQKPPFVTVRSGVVTGD